MNRIPPLPEVSGCEVDDVRFLDGIEAVQVMLDEAEKLFHAGERCAGVFMLGKAACSLEALA
jgi:hypothetical protein